mmetsp:Transcript_93601/g.267841  ORF Transcript_93601/g.267841 Transcript_93601/m.267841 type:complete len:224 (+) Transcript_93601:110-781(+)
MTGGFSRKFGTQLGYGPTDMVARLPLLWRVAFTRYRKLSFAALITAPVAGGALLMYAVMPSTPSPRHADGTAQRGGLAVDLASGTQDAGSSTESHASGGAATGSGAVSNEAMRRRQSEKQRLQQNDALRYSTATCSLFVLYGVWDGAATTQVLKYPPLACLCSDPRTLILSASARLLSGCTTYCGPARSMLKDLPKRTMREKLEAVHDAQGKFMEDHSKPRGW